MTNLIDYVEETFQGMKELPFSDVDSLVLSQFAYLHFDGQVPGITQNGEAVLLRDLLRAECFSVLFRDVRDETNNRRLLIALAASPRFRNIRMSSYVNRIDSGMQKQFSAVTYQLEDQTAYLAFRGTDATLVGWKEDFNMAFICPIPSQQDAVRYVEQAAGKITAAIRLGGHSKGGNLAVYAAMMCSPKVRGRITAVYSHDGPGFHSGILQQDCFAEISGQIHKTLPQSSLVGMLLETQEDYTVVESSRIGIMQHDPFSWKVENGAFCTAKGLKGSAQQRSKTLNSWLNGLSSQERETFVDTLFRVMEASGAGTISELGDVWQKSLPSMLAAVKDTDEDTRNQVLKTVKDLAVMSIKNFRIGKS